MAGFRSRAVVVVVSGLLTAVVAAAPSRPHHSDVICHTSNSSDCYPRVFVPTHDFQIVHDDQDLPPGLHVRINIETHKKEAKINVPGEQEAGALNGVLVKDVATSPESQDSAQHIPKGAPAYDAVGKVKEPERDSGSFVAALTKLGDGSLADESLDHIEELAHDIYYGLQLAENTEAVKTLLCLMVVVPSDSPSFTSRDHRAASILAGALSNNAAAQTKVADAWPRLAASNCSSNSNVSLGQALISMLAPPPTTAGSMKEAASLAKAKMSVVNGLIKNANIRRDFLNGGMMTNLLEMLTLESKDWADAQRKAGELVLDNFLDENMGARLGQWPRVSRLSDEQCRTGSLAEGCWDYHVDGVMRANGAAPGHWSTVLHEKLAAARGKPGASGGEDGDRHEL
ncbi:Nucleotide exchange factor SIL1 [Ophiocordyceps camponoti-floridani]|uniref:Nucleotide exchange factor SIL1 n=1 Tax=Ophiocordyceps camponoti-floridani TaxID=2030778 RepID=A0A8H4Q484_9HYPO|nr:Nucleotide exchange factor SIL1 [Ophiocordyceps camponoti-floridani]